MAAMSRDAACQQDKKKECKWRKISRLLFENSDNKARRPDNVDGEDDVFFSSLGHLC
jgi:hypothetical protein